MTSASSTTSSSSSSTSSSTSSRSRTRQEVVAEARQSVTDKKRKLEALTAFLAAPATTPAKALDEPSPSAGKQKKKPKKPKKSKKQKLLHHSNTGSSNPSVDLLAAQLKTKVACRVLPSCPRQREILTFSMLARQDLRDFLLWLYAVQAKPSPAVFFSNPATLPTTVMVVIRSLGQGTRDPHQRRVRFSCNVTSLLLCSSCLLSLAAELIKHKGLLKNMLTTEEGGIFQKATAFNAPGSKYVCMACSCASLPKRLCGHQSDGVRTCWVYSSPGTASSRRWPP